MELPLPDVYFENFDDSFDEKSKENNFHGLWSDLIDEPKPIEKKGWEILTPEEVLKIYDGIDINEDEEDCVFCNLCSKNILKPQIWNVYDDGRYIVQLCSVKCLIKYKNTWI
tara:strand:+ start:2998 stop:3333 length:336 start_codon:yes stop_codon:yes gene_type:complete